MPPSRKAAAKADELLLKATRAGDLKGIQDRLAAGVDVNAADKREAPAIFAAVANGKLEVVEVLLAAHADVNRIAYPTSGASLKSTPLCFAIDGGFWEIVQALVKAGADIALEPWEGQNAATEAADKATKAHYTLTAPEDEWLSKPRTKAVLERAKADHARWMKFVRDAIAQGVKVRNYSLWSAVNSRHAELALLLISSGVDPNTAPHGTSVLVRAIERGSDEIALALMKAGANVKTPQRSVPLLMAAEKGRISLVPALLDAGTDINAIGDVTIAEMKEAEVEETPTEDGVSVRTTHFSDPVVAESATALIVATRLGNLAFVKLLIERGADLNIGDKHGLTAMAWALKLKKPDLVESLKSAGAQQPEFLEGSLSTTLWTAAKSGDAAKVEMLLKRGAKPDEPVKDREGTHFALVSAAREGHLEVVQTLLRHQANVNVGATENWSGDVMPLMTAARQGHVEIIKTLLAAGASLESKDAGFEDGGDTALHYAARGGHVTAIQTLIAAGAKVNAKAKGGRTPLLVAVSEIKSEAAKALLAAGADTNAGPSDGSGPLFSATMKNDAELVKLLLDHGASPMPRGKKQDFQPLGDAASKGSLEIMKLLLKAGAPINGQDVLGHTALASAALYGRADVCQFLLENNADPHIASRDGMTPLMCALRSGKEPVVALLLKAGADATALTNDGRTTLKIAQEGKKPNIIALIEAAIAQAPAEAKAAAVKQVEKTAAKKRAAAETDDEDEEEIEPPDFSEAAAKPEFQAVLREVEKLCGSPAKSLGDVKGGYSFTVASGEAEKLLAAHHERLLQKGAYFFRNHRGSTGSQDKLGLLPTKDWADLILAVQTNGANYDLMPGDIVKWMEKLSTKQPFVITGVSWDWLEGRFTTPIKGAGARKLAHRMYEFCPDIVDQGIGTVKKLAQALEKDGYFFFWWD